MMSKHDELNRVTNEVKEYIHSPEADFYSPDSLCLHVEAVEEGISRVDRFLDRASEGETELLASCSWELGVVEDHYRRVYASLKDDDMKQKWEKTVEKKVLEGKIREVNSRPSSDTLSNEAETQSRVLPVEERRFHLVCSVCRQIACAFHSGVWHMMRDRGERVIYRGFTRETTISPAYEQDMYGMLEEEKINRLHEFLSTARMVTDTLASGEKTERRNFLMEDGLDTYCPDCDRIFCQEHWKTRELMDDGFYDYTEGTCPDGHTRMLDD